MLIDPDFVDHWKVRMLADSISDELAPIYLLRLWSHCQLRKTWVFDRMSSAALKALCRYPGDPVRFESAMIEGGWIVREGDMIALPKWAEHNSQLVKAWVNGGKGGRPKPDGDNSGLTRGLTGGLTQNADPVNHPVNPEAEKGASGLTHGLTDRTGLDLIGLENSSPKTDETQTKIAPIASAGINPANNTVDLALHWWCFRTKAIGRKPTAQEVTEALDAMIAAGVTTFEAIRDEWTSERFDWSQTFGNWRTTIQKQGEQKKRDAERRTTGNGKSGKPKESVTEMVNRLTGRKL